MPSYVFHLRIRDGQHDRLRQLNEEYAPALTRATQDIAGLGGIEKHLLGDDYVERIDFDGEFADFAKQLGADREVRQFLRQVDECFEQSLREMPERRMSCLQRLPG